jgi:putative glycosyltransferase (TIGR04348 family)
MNIRIVTPAGRGSPTGNRVTAERWAALLTELGHRVTVATDWRTEACDVLVALHARKSARVAERWRRARPEGPLIIALTGTDIYCDLHRSPAARRALAMATRIVTLQPRAIRELPRALRPRARAIFQSAASRRAPRRSSANGTFQICVLGHLRAVKDPLRAALASRLVPGASRIQIVQAGRALEPRLAARARTESANNPRYQWVGELSAQQAGALLAGSRLLALTSRLEGGANVVSEAIAAGVPVVSSRIDGSVGILGSGYPGYFPVGDSRALARLLVRAERDQAFYQRLSTWCQRLRPLVAPDRERRSWARLLAELDRQPGGRGSPRRANAAGGG